jgi:anti-sigma regulatory factor (Ser/Thr protein kinase)
MNAAAKAFPARMSALNDVLTHVAEICLRAGLTGDNKACVALVIEELFSNTVEHGYGRDSDRPVWISARSDGSVLRLIYQDEAPAFNPLNRPKETLSVQPGGWGTQLVESFADTAYRYENGCNTMTLTFKIN